MMIKEFRVYAEVCEQGIDLRNYFLNLEKDIPCKLILLRKAKINQENIIFKYRKLKNFDAFITFITEEEKEYPISAIEYSNSVRTDDHIMQRFDGVYWAGQLKIPYIKFSSSEINNNNFGGGNKIKIEHEYNIAHKVGAVFKHFDIPLIPNTNIANTNKERLSCPNFLLELEKYFFNIINYIKESLNYNEIYSKLLNSSYNSEVLPEFSNSDRLIFDKDNLILKFNRFGHAMDPEKGMLYFFYSFGKKVSISFEMYRGDHFSKRKGYKSLFDELATEKELLSFIKNKNFNFNKDDYLYMFSTAISFKNLQENSTIDGDSIYIDDNILENFLKISNSQTIKSLFYFSENIIILGKDRQIIFKILWNHEIVKLYYKNILEIKNYEKTKLANKISINDISEDLVTYFTQLYFRKLSCRIASVSYPNAQGDRAILSGEGRGTKRTYYDLISYDCSGNIFLVEAKEKHSSLKDDIKKLQELKENENKKININKLIKEIDPEFDNLKNLYVGVASKVNCEENLENILLNTGIDYAFGYKLLEENKLICMIKTNNKKLNEIFEKNIIGDIRKFYTVI